MAIEILDSGSVKVLALVTFAADGVLPTVVGKGIRSYAGNGASVELVPLDPIPPDAVIFVTPVNNGFEARFIAVELDAAEPGDDGEIELQQLDIAGDPLAAVGTWSVLLIYPQQMAAVAGELS